MSSSYKAFDATPIAQIHFKKRKRGRPKGTTKKAVVKTINNVLNRRTELKLKDSGLSNIAVNNIGQFWTLTSITQGDGDSQRNGDRLMVAGYIQLHVMLNAYTATGNLQKPRVRLIVFQWHPQSINTAPPALTDILDVNIVTGLIDTNCFYNWDKRQQFKILKDVIIDVVNTGNSNNTFNIKTQITRFFNISLKKAKKQLQYAGNLASTATNQIYAYCFTNDAASAVDPVIYSLTRLCYRDS